MMQEKLTIVKVGGAVIEDEKKLVSFMDAFKQIENKKLLVHGGGKMANQLAASLNIEVKMVDGRRVTDDQMIEVVILAYSSLNKKLSALLESKGIRSVGLTGADGDTIRSIKRPVKNGLDFGWVGDIEKVNDQLLADLLSSGSVPVMAPLTHDGNGQLLNTNADTIASELAVDLSDSFSVSLNYIFDQKGVMKDLNDPQSLIKAITHAGYQELKKEGVITGGMVPKLDNAFETLERGVNEVRLLDVDALYQLDNPDFDEFTVIH